MGIFDCFKKNRTPQRPVPSFHVPDVSHGRRFYTIAANATQDVVKPLLEELGCTDIQMTLYGDAPDDFVYSAQFNGQEIKFVWRRHSSYWASDFRGSNAIGSLDAYSNGTDVLDPAKNPAFATWAARTTA